MAGKFNLKYHIVWCTKYRRKVLSEDMQSFLKIKIEEVCTKNGYTLHAVECMPDHIHIFIEASQKDSVHRVVSQIKGFTSFELRNTFTELKSRLPSMWTRSYYAGTVGHVSEDTVRKYIENQKNV